MRGTWVEVWHPDSPGTRVQVYRAWWKRKFKTSATLSEVIKSHRYAKPKHLNYIDVIRVEQEKT